MRSFPVTEKQLVLIQDFSPLPIYYDRANEHYGIPVDKPVPWKVNPVMAVVYERFVKLLLEVYGGDVVAILSGGMRNDRLIRGSKTSLSPHHIAKGATADDFDGIIYLNQYNEEEVYIYDFSKAVPNQKYTTKYEILNPTDKMKTRIACISYMAGFTTNLTWHYPKHKDHIHRDLLSEPGYHGNKSQNLHWQECLNAWFEVPYKDFSNFSDKPDGKVGRKTVMKTIEALNIGKKVGINGNGSNWLVVASKIWDILLPTVAFGI